MTLRLRAAGALMAWLAFVAAMVVALHAVGGRLAPPPLSSLDGAPAWLEQRQPVDVVFAVLRLVALVLGWYLLVVTVVSVAARLLRLAAVVTVVDVVTVPSVRRLVNAALGLSLVATAYPGVAAASEPPAVETMRRLPDDAPGAAGGVAPPEPATAPTITMRRLPDEPPASPSPKPAPTTTAPTTTAPNPAPGSWAVRPGDHFWAVAERVLTDTWGRPPTDAEVGPYWQALVEANRSRLADPANPDLLFPGQTVTVPSPPARPA